MIEFEDSQLRKLQEVSGVVLNNVHGERVAIGKDFEYENVFSFMVHYFNFIRPMTLLKSLDIRAQ